MSTMSLTLIASVIGIASLMAVSISALWYHEVPRALMSLGGTCLLAHLLMVLLGWAGAAQPNPLPERILYVAEPISQMPTWAFDVSAVAAVSLIAISTAIDMIQEGILLYRNDTAEEEETDA